MLNSDSLEESCATKYPFSFLTYPWSWQSQTNCFHGEMWIVDEAAPILHEDIGEMTEQVVASVHKWVNVSKNSLTQIIVAE